MSTDNKEDSVLSSSETSDNHNNIGDNLRSSDLINEEIKANQVENKINNENTNKENADKPSSSTQDDKNEEEEEWMDILGTGQLKKKVLKKGEPNSRPTRADLCKIRLVGKLENGDVVENQDCQTIHVGDAEVIQGLDFVIPLMDVGEEAEAVVGPRFGYGSKGRLPDIPPFATLNYTITLLSAEPEPEINTLSISDRKDIGNRKKERGNWWYSRDENTLAIQCYRRALDYLDDIENSPDNIEEKLNESEIRDLLEERIKVYNNLAAAQLKIKAYDTALKSVEHVLRCQPNNVKALYRKGKILAAKGEINESVAVLRNALIVDPNSEATKKELERVASVQKKHSAQERNLYKKMLGTNENNKPLDEKSKHSTFQNITLTWGLFVGSVAALVLGAVAFRNKLF